MALGTRYPYNRRSDSGAPELDTGMDNRKVSQVEMLLHAEGSGAPMVFAHSKPKVRTLETHPTMVLEGPLETPAIKLGCRLSI